MLLQGISPAYAAWKFKSKKKTPVQTETPAVFEEPELIPTDKEKEQSEQLKNDPNAIYIKDIQFEGNKLIKSSDMAKMMKLQAGDVYSRDMVQQSLKELYKMGYFTEKIKALPVKVDEHNVILKITVEENMPITGFTIEGNEVLSVGDISAAIADLKGQPQNMVMINQAITNIEELYASKGYILARVTAVYDDPDGVINFEIEEGHINSIAIEGNKKTKDFVIERIQGIEGRVVKCTPNQLTRRFQRAIQFSGLPHFRFHDLRHYSASFMHAIGIPDSYIMERGGWQTDNVMKTVYRHTLNDRVKEMNRKVNAEFNTLCNTKCNTK